MKTFEEVMEFTRTVSSNAAFEDPECFKYFNVLNILNQGAHVLEIGLQYGRSSSIALQVAKDRGLRYTGVDSFLEAEPNVREKWISMAEKIGHPFSLNVSKSADCGFREPIDALLIDGDHDEAGVRADCEMFVPLVMRGGFAMFHDYGSDSLPDVCRVVNQYFASLNGWQYEGTAGTLGVWRRDFLHG